VLYHGAGFARALHARLRIMHVAERGTTEDAAARVSAAYAAAIPYDVSGDDPDFAVRTGGVAERIVEEGADPRIELLVIGTRARGSLSRLVLGSTSEGVLRATTAPVLLVPPGDLDIVALGSGRASLTTGPVLAAVDLAESNVRQLTLASELAQTAAQPLLLLAVDVSSRDEHDTAARLRERAHGIVPLKPHALIVRRGNVAEEITRCAAAEHAGLVVMGLSDGQRGKPGAIAASVLHARHTFVLAVPHATA
jgi:nucleotide-binding universal stress UspA family protein